MKKIPQIELARMLGVTPRRVRQMVKDHLLPPPDDDELYDGAECETLYSLYTDGDDYAWSRFYDDLGRCSGEIDRLVRRLEKISAKGDDAIDAIGAAAVMTIQTFTRLRFALSARVRSKPEYPLLMQKLDMDEAQQFAPIIAKVKEIYGEIRWDA